MLHLTAEAAVHIRNALPAANDGAGNYLLRVAPAAPDEVHGLKLSFVTAAGEGDQVTTSQGLYLSIDRQLSYELDDKLIDLTPDGESVYIRSG